MLLRFSACAPKTAYVRPTVEIAPAFRESADWKPAQPADDVLRGNWWELYGDPELNALEAQIDVSSQTLKAAAAQFAQARALVRGSRANLFPTVDVVPSAVRSESSGNRAASTFHQAANDFILPVDVSYEVDVWGRIRGTISASQANAQASAADLEAARLSLHAELAADYFTLRGIDRDRELLLSAVESFSKALELTQNRFQGGIASQADVAQAETRPRDDPRAGGGCDRRARRARTCNRGPGRQTAGGADDCRRADAGRPAGDAGRRAV